MPKEGALVEEDVPLRNAMNEVLRDAYVDDCQRGVDRWNKRLVEAGVQGRLRLLSKPFYRDIGIYADMPRHRRQAALARGLGPPQGRMAPHRRRPRGLLRPQDHQRIHARRAPGGEDDRHEGRRADHGHDRAVGHRVGGADLEEEPRDRVARGQGQG